MISKYLERLVRKDLVYCRPALEGLACQADADVAGYIDKRFSDLSGIFLRYRKGKKPGLRPEVLARYRAELDEAGEWYRREAMDWYFSKKRQRDIALIEYPLLSHKIAVRMQKKGIPYLFATNLSEGNHINVGGLHIWQEGHQIHVDRSRVYRVHPGYEHVHSVTPEVGDTNKVEILVHGHLVEMYINDGQYVVSNIVYDLGGWFKTDANAEIAVLGL